jgi:hypothetical protein
MSGNPTCQELATYRVQRLLPSCRPSVQNILLPRTTAFMDRDVISMGLASTSSLESLPSVNPQAKAFARCCESFKSPILSVESHLFTD